MKIKDEYKGKTIVISNSVLGDMKIVVDKIELRHYSYIKGIGLGYIFETEKQAEPDPIRYEGIEQPIKPRKTRTKKA